MSAAQRGCCGGWKGPIGAPEHCLHGHVYSRCPTGARPAAAELLASPAHAPGVVLHIIIIIIWAMAHPHVKPLT